MYQHAASGFVDLRVLDARGGRCRGARAASGGTSGCGGAAAERRHAGRRGRRPARLRPRARRARADPARRAAGAVRRPRRGLRAATTATDVHAALLDGDLRRAGRRRARSAPTVVFPPSDFRYYRIRATGVKEIEVRRRRQSPRPARRSTRPAEVVVRQEERRTVIDADVGTAASRCTSSASRRRRPPSTVPSRSRLDGRQGVLRRRRRPPVPLRRGRRDALPLNSRYRYLRIRIENGDDEPLQDLRVTLRAYRDYILLAPGLRAALPRALRRPGGAAGVRLRAAARGAGTARGRRCSARSAGTRPSSRRPTRARSPSGIPG